MRHLFIINPAAGRPESTARLEPLLSRLSFPHEVAYTREAGDAQRLAATAVRTGGPVRIYACGGDGPQRAFDLMDCNGKLGLDVVCAGVDARIAAGVHRYKDLRFVSGIGAYLLSLAEQVIFRGLCRPLTIRADGLDWQERQTAILCICNGRHYGGGFMPVPDAMPDDGVLDVLAVGEISRLTFFRLVGKYAQGLYRQYPQLITDWHGQSLSFSSPREITVVVDGEVMRGTRFTVRLSPLKINFFFPAGADYSPEF